jgi:hypothetical protein
LHVRETGSPPRAPDEVIPTTHLERNVGRYAVGCVVTGLLIIIVAFFR